MEEVALLDPRSRTGGQVHSERPFSARIPRSSPALGGLDAQRKRISFDCSKSDQLRTRPSFLYVFDNNSARNDSLSFPIQLGTSPRLEILKLAGYEPFLSPILTNIADSRAYSGGHHESSLLHQSGLSVFTPVPLLKSLYLGILPTRIDRKPIWRALRSLYTVSENSSPSSPHPTAPLPALVISPKYVDVDRWFPKHVENFRIEPSSSEGTLWVSPDSLSDNADDFERFYRLSKKARRKFPGIYVPPPDEDSDSEWYD